MNEKEREERRSRKGDKEIKCVLCGEEAEYVKDGMSLCEMHFTQQVGNKDIDLMKIQIYAHKCQTFLAVRLSLGFVVLGLWSVFAAVYYQSLSTFNLPFIHAGWVGMGVILTITLIAFGIFWLMYYKDSRRISQMIEVVRKGVPLPALDKLDKWH
jgi:hypothetical protein